MNETKNDIFLYYKVNVPSKNLIKLNLNIFIMVTDHNS